MLQKDLLISQRDVNLAEAQEKAAQEAAVAATVKRECTMQYVQTAAVMHKFHLSHQVTDLFFAETASQDSC